MTPGSIVLLLELDKIVAGHSADTGRPIARQSESGWFRCVLRKPLIYLTQPHVHPSSMSQFAHAHLMDMSTHRVPPSTSHSAHAHLTVIMCTHRACRSLPRPILRSYLSTEHVAFYPCPAHGDTCISKWSYFAHAHLTVVSTHRACRIFICPPHDHTHPHRACRIHGQHATCSMGGDDHCETGMGKMRHARCIWPSL